MIRKIYLDFIRNKISENGIGWLAKRGVQYCLVHLSFLAGRPLCGPILGTVVTTYRCNYRCKMCNLPQREEEAQRRGLREFPTEQMKHLLKELAELGTAGIGFTGGEPLLRADIFELLRYSKDLGMITHLNTNGFFLNDENISRLFQTEVDSVNISLDGATAKTHDFIRGYQGAFQRVIDAVQRIVERRRHEHKVLRLKLVMVINEFNVHEVKDMLSLSATLGTDCTEFIPQQPFVGSDYGCAQSSNAQFLRQIKEIQDFLLRQKRAGANIENSARHLKLFERSFKNSKSPLACYAGYNSYAVDCYGMFYPCMPWINRNHSIGSIENTGLKEFWYSQAYNQVRPEISKCRDCYLNCQAELNLLFNSGTYN